MLVAVTLLGLVEVVIALAGIFGLYGRKSAALDKRMLRVWDVLFVVLLTLVVIAVVTS